MGFDLVRQPLLWYNRLNEVVYLNFRRVVRMSGKVSKGIALLLFGILLCAGSGEINTTILYNFGDFPFAAIGVIVGAEGLYMVFSDKAE